MKRISLAKIITALCICNIYVFTCGVMGNVKSVSSAAAQDSTAESTESSTPQEENQEQNATAQGTIDFIIPDESWQSSGSVSMQFNNFRQPDIADMVVHTTCAPVGEEPDVMDDVDFDIIIPNDSPYEDYIALPNEAPTATTTATQAPSTTAASVSTTAATTAAATTVSTTTAATTTAATTTVSTTTATTTVAETAPAGIPVESTTAETTTTEAEITQQPAENNAANEIITVKNGSEVVSGSAVEIIARITQNEVGYAFAPEAIKAQAVAAYTYVKFCNKYGTYPNVILADSINDSVRVLVESVIGECVYYNGEIIQAVYSASSAGYTASSEVVWGNYYPYLVSKYCELDKLYDPNYGKTAAYTSSDIRDRVYSKTGIYLEGDPSEWLAVIDCAEGFYVGQMSIGGNTSYTDSDGDVLTITGKRFRETIMSYDLRSSAFDVEYDAATDSFIFTTYGYGHGVGMSQNGANILATYWGYDYKDILTFYYDGCEVY